VPRLLSSPSLRIMLLFFTCLHLCRDRETLAQRGAKRAKASAGGQPPAGTSSTPLVVVESSPRHSPQRKLITLPSLSCVGGMILVADFAVCRGSH